MLVATHPFDPFAVSLHGTVVVEASAGTGKTHAIASLVLRLVVERCIDVDRIAVVTFTRAAAGELRERVRRRLRDALDALEASGGGRSGVRRDGDPELEAWVEGRRRSGTTDRDCARLRRGLRGLDEACVDTIHGFCRRVLRAHGGPEGLLVEGTRLVDPRRLVDELVHDGWLAVLQRETGVHVEEIATASDLGWLRTIGRQVVEDPTLTVEPSAGAPMDATTRWRVAFAHQVRQAAQRRKQALGLRFINDTLHRLHAKLCVVRDEPLRRAIAGAYDAILVDEFQDTDTVQYELFATLAGARPRDLLLVLIGDPRQAIYGFRGANVHAYCWALRQCETQPQTLLVNRRSDPPLVEAVNRLFEAARRPFVTDAIAFRRAQPAPDGRIRLVGGRAGPPLTLFAVRGGGELHVAAACIARAAAWLLEEPAQIADADNRRRAIDAGDLAVLTRTNEQANAVQRALQSLGVPAVHAGEASVLQSTEAEELERIVRALATPDEPRVLYAALATRPFGLNAVELVQARADASKGMEWNGRFRRACALLQSRGPAAAVWTLFREVAAERRLLERPEGARALTNYAHVLELLDTVSRERGLGPQRLVAWLSRARSDPDGLGGLDPELVQLRLESDARAVRVMTIHRAKGLEFPIVVVGWLWTPIGARDRDPVVRYHDPTRDVAPHLDVGSTSIDKHRELAHREALSEALRLAYVALTRARHRCLVGYLEREADPAYDGAPRVRSPETSPLEYLLGHAIAAARSGSQGVDSPEPVTREGLELLARASGSVMGVLDMGEEASPRRGMPHSATRLVAPERTRRVESERNPRTASFSSLVGELEDEQADLEEGVDHDGVGGLVGSSGLEAGGGSAVRLAAFPAGPVAGRCVHAILERVDFTAGPEAWRLECERALDAHGLARDHLPLLFDALVDLFETPLRDGLRLREVAPTACVRELGFVLPVAGGARMEAAPNEGASLLTPKGLAAVLRAHGGPAADAEYVSRVEQLRFEELVGFLKGYVDCVLEHDRRLYIVDWKTNWLGPSPADYAPDRLRVPMREHHYYLQYLLYAVAVRRWFRSRLPHDDFAARFGGVLYLFVRGIAPHHPAGCGVFHDRPDEALLESLDRLLGPMG